MHYKITPKSLILSILQIAGTRAMPVKELVSCGEIFGFTSNTIRVSTTRLIREESVESDERGLYRLSRNKTPISNFVDSWRTGEERLISWDGCWICCLLPKTRAAKQTKSQRALSFIGFREGLPGLWVRPNNLKLGMGGILKILRQMKIQPNAELFIARQFDNKLTEQWSRFLWPIPELIQAYEKNLEKLESSTRNIKTMPFENALVESYLVGSETVHTLVTDPLLPEEMMQSKYRRALIHAMLSYDEIGKTIWAGKFEGLKLDRSPSHLRLVAEM